MGMRLFVLLGAACVAQATTIVSVTGPQTFGAAAGQQQFVTAGFTTGQNYANVSISAVIGGLAAQSVTAYLTTQIGPGTTQAANEVATAVIPLPGPGGILTPIFTGLALPAGSYYLTLADNTFTAGAWYSTNAPVVATAPGSSAGFDGYYITNYPMVGLPAYAPAATYAALTESLLYQVETTQVPEPSTAGLMLLTGAALAVRGFGRRRVR
jgi:hypothetical protein